MSAVISLQGTELAAAGGGELATPAATPSVSVCIPTYNGSAHLSATLASIDRQSFRDYEIILVDDCSIDGTFELASRVAKGDQVRVLRNERRLGLAQNWNRCIALARGEWIKFVFQDDLLETSCIEAMLAIAKRGAKLVFCRREFLFEDGIDEGIRNSYLTLPQIDDALPSRAVVPAADVALALLSTPKNFFGEPTAALIHRTLLDRHGVFNPDLLQLCDLEMWARLAVNEGLGYVPEPLVKFRVHGRSATARNRNDHAFRTRYLDTLVLRHQFAYDPAFMPLRKEAQRRNGVRALRKEVAEMSVWVHALAGSLARDPVHPDPTPLHEWSQVAVKYPRLRTSLWHLPLAIKALWSRRVAWRLSGRARLGRS